MMDSSPHHVCGNVNGHGDYYWRHSHSHSVPRTASPGPFGGGGGGGGGDPSRYLSWPLHAASKVVYLKPRELPHSHESKFVRTKRGHVIHTLTSPVMAPPCCRHSAAVMGAPPPPPPEKRRRRGVRRDAHCQTECTVHPLEDLVVLPATNCKEQVLVLPEHFTVVAEGTDG